MEYRGQSQTMHTLYSAARVGILLTNLGTPAAPTAAALRPYLRQFLSDYRVIELPRWKWWPILHGIILRVRPARSAALYQQVWTDAGSPLLQITLAQRDKLAARLQAAGASNAVVKAAMRYGEPAIGKVLREFQDEGINRIVVLPLYPQYSGPTTGSTFDALSQELTTWRWMPQLNFLNSYHDHPLYVAALARCVAEHMQTRGKPERLLLSYHGMPQRYFDAGDPYFCLCQKTSRLVAEQLGLTDKDYVTTFQSRFGREEWLKPYTSETLENLARDGVKHVAVICPGFSADCLETIEEIGAENRKIFLDAGGESFHYIPALNDRDDHIEMMMDLVSPYLSQSP